MNFKKACETLEIEMDKNLSKETLKRHYRIKALKYHPDKNKCPNASEQFQNIQLAYEYLSEHIYSYDDIESDEETNEDYQNNYNKMLFSFFKNIIGGDVQHSIYQIILNKISNTCENKAIELIEKLDKSILIKTCDMIKKYKDVFHFSPFFFDKIEEMAKEKIRDDECIILNPEIDDLFENNLYKLNVGEYTYAVPLWHHELVYDNLGNDLYVKCIPILPENLFIDNKNNIIVSINCKIMEIWMNEKIDIQIGKKTFTYDMDKLKMTRKQTVVLEKMGISKINTTNVYDISKRSDIILHITIT